MAPHQHAVDVQQEPKGRQALRREKRMIAAETTGERTGRKEKLSPQVIQGLRETKKFLSAGNQTQDAAQARKAPYP